MVLPDHGFRGESGTKRDGLTTLVLKSRRFVLSSLSLALSSLLLSSDLLSLSS